MKNNEERGWEGDRDSTYIYTYGTHTLHHNICDWFKRWWAGVRSTSARLFAGRVSQPYNCSLSSSTTVGTPVGEIENERDKLTFLHKQTTAGSAKTIKVT